MPPAVVSLMSSEHTPRDSCSTCSLTGLRAGWLNGIGFCPGQLIQWALCVSRPIFSLSPTDPRDSSVHGVWRQEDACLLPWVGSRGQGAGSASSPNWPQLIQHYAQCSVVYNQWRRGWSSACLLLPPCPAPGQEPLNTKVTHILPPAPPRVSPTASGRPP